MARGENPGQVISVPCTLTYDKNAAFGHANAGKDLQLELVTSGGDAGKYKLLAENGKPGGKFLELHADGTASLMINSTTRPVIMKQSAVSGAPLGSRVIGGPAISSVGGYVKAAPDPGSTYNAGAITAINRLVNSYGTVFKVLENTAGGRILVLPE